MGKGKNKVARVLEKVATKIAKVSTDSVCIIIYHQPRVPKSLKELGDLNGKEMR